MKQIFCIGLWLIAFTGCRSHEVAGKSGAQQTSPALEKDGKGKAAVLRYQALATELLKVLQSPNDWAGTKSASQNVATKAKALHDLGDEIGRRLGLKVPVCDAYLKVLLDASPRLADLSLEAIEADFHRDGKLPKSPDERCYHAKDLIVHPATVTILNRQGLDKSERRVQATAEIAEVLGHLEKVQRVFD